MAVKRYDGSAWQTVAGLGAQGAAATSSSIATWVKTASGGETSVSGNDDNSQPLSYTVGQELVFINGVLQKRGADYTATTGNSITGLTALTSGDIVSVWTVNAFSVTNAISNTIMDAKGDLLTASGADVPARLAVGSNDTVLTADSSTATGLKWATPSSGGMTQLSSTSLTGSSVTLSSIDQTYRSLFLVIVGAYGSTTASLRIRCNGSSTANTYIQISAGSTAAFDADGWSIGQFYPDATANVSVTTLNFLEYARTNNRKMAEINYSHLQSATTQYHGQALGIWNDTSAISSIVIGLTSGNWQAGTAILYGVK